MSSEPVDLEAEDTLLPVETNATTPPKRLKRKEAPLALSPTTLPARIVKPKTFASIIDLIDMYDPDDDDDANDNMDLDSSASSFPLSSKRPPRSQRTDPTSPSIVVAAASNVSSAQPAPEDIGRRPWQLTAEDFKRCHFDYRLWHNRYTIFNSHAHKAVGERGKIIDIPPALKAERQKELQYLASDLHSIWTLGCSLNSTDRRPDAQVDVLGIAHAMFFDTLTTKIKLNIAVVDAQMKRLEEPLISLFSHHKLYDLADPENEEHNRSLSKLNCVFMALRNSYRMFLHICAAELSLNPASNGIIPSNKVLFFVESYTLAPSRIEDAKPFTRLILHLINVAAQMGYRRYRGGVYEEKITPEGYRTHFWKRVMDIETFVSLETSRDHSFEMFNLSTGSGGLTKNATTFLTEFYDAEFPFVYVDRHVFSFRNGVYFAAQRKFRRFADGAVNWGVDSAVTDKRKQKKIGNHYGEVAGRTFTNASANYFDMDFVEYDNWSDIPTPTVDKLLNDQEIPADAQRIVWGLLGRILYNVGELDDWQIILYLLGRANSGKSTLCKIVPIFYQQEDVAVLSNNIEEQFGLQGVYNKLAFIAPEIKKDFRLPQALFQSMVSGEGMSVPIKFKEAVTVDWHVPGIIAGNDVPSWVDNSNSVVRRVAMVNFQKPILRVDGEISNKLKDEVGAILLKANHAYHLMLEDYGSRGIWEMLPPYFKETQDSLKAKTHPLYNFLKSGELEFVDKSLYISVDAFRNAFSAHCNKINQKRSVWNEELYVVPLQDYNLKIERPESIEWPIGTGIQEHRLDIIRGVILREHRYALSQQLPDAFAKGSGGGPVPIYDQDGGGGAHKAAATATNNVRPGLVTHKAIPAFGVSLTK